MAPEEARLAPALIGMRTYADQFWTVVLPPTHICYATLSFLQLLPPWMAKPDEDSSVRSLS
jgi:hypothetical protein